MEEGSYFHLRGVLKGHLDWVTALATPPENNDVIISASRDKSIIIWDLHRTEPTNYGTMRRSLRGHSHFIQDLAISSDGQFCLSGSWDNTLRLWDLNTGLTTRRFFGHKKEVLSVAFSLDNRQIVSGSRDRTIKLWNTLGECKYTIEDGGHSEWVSCVRFSPAPSSPHIVSAGWDKVVKLWSLTNCKLVANLPGHTGYINTITVAPDGSLCASGGKDSTAILWDLNEGKRLYALEAGDLIHALCFSPNRYWLSAGTQSGIRVWDLETKTVIADLTKSSTNSDYFLNPGKTSSPACISLAWSADGQTLFAGYTDNTIRVWSL